MKKLIPFLLIILSELVSGQNIEPVRKAVQEINQTKGFKIKTVPYSVSYTHLPSPRD